jgi:hypothetical protein
VSKTIEERLRLLEDREEITQLKARYCNLNDGGWREQGPTHTHIEELEALFVEGAIWDGGPVAGRAEGRGEIGKLFTVFQSVPFVIHNVMNPIIKIDGDCATGHWHAIIAATDPEGQALWTLGIYDEVYVRTAEGWRYKSLTFIPAANAPYELGWGKDQFHLPSQGGYRR